MRLRAVGDLAGQSRTGCHSKGPLLMLADITTTPNRHQLSWVNATTGPVRWGKTAVSVAALNVDHRRQLRLLATPSARQQFSRQELGRLRRRARARLRALEAMPGATSHIIEGPSLFEGFAVSTWDLWTVQAWLYYRTIPWLARTAVMMVEPQRGSDDLASATKPIVELASAVSRIELVNVQLLNEAVRKVPLEGVGELPATVLTLSSAS